jgi:hypothetical protein
VTEHDRTIDGARGRGDPAGRDPRFEELVGRRSVIPHGDRVDGAKSCRIEDEEARRLLDDHVVGELVLNDDVNDVAPIRATPREHVFERPQAIDAHTYWFSREQNQR